MIFYVWCIIKVIHKILFANNYKLSCISPETRKFDMHNGTQLYSFISTAWFNCFVVTC